MKDRALHLMEYQEYSIEMIAELLGYWSLQPLIMHLNGGLVTVHDNMGNSLSIIMPKCYILTFPLRYN